MLNFRDIKVVDELSSLPKVGSKDIIYMVQCKDNGGDYPLYNMYLYDPNLDKYQLVNKCETEAV